MMMLALPYALFKNSISMPPYHFVVLNVVALNVGLGGYACQLERTAHLVVPLRHMSP